MKQSSTAILGLVALLAVGLGWAIGTGAFTGGSLAGSDVNAACKVETLNGVAFTVDTSDFRLPAGVTTNTYEGKVGSRQIPAGSVGSTSVTVGACSNYEAIVTNGTNHNCFVTGSLDGKSAAQSASCTTALIGGTNYTMLGDLGVAAQNVTIGTSGTGELTFHLDPNNGTSAYTLGGTSQAAFVNPAIGKLAVICDLEATSGSTLINEIDPATTTLSLDGKACSRKTDFKTSNDMAFECGGITGETLAGAGSDLVFGLHAKAGVNPAGLYTCWLVPYEYSYQTVGGVKQKVETPENQDGSAFLRTANNLQIQGGVN